MVGTKVINDNFINSNDEELFEIVGVKEEELDTLDSAPYSYWKSVFKVMLKNKLVWFCIFMLVVVLFFTIFGNLWSYYDLANFSAGEKYLRPNADHFFGINGKNQDVWTATWIGAKTSLAMAVIVALLDAIVGLIIGSIWGFFPQIDGIMIEIRNFIVNIPGLLLNMMLMKLLLSMRFNDFWSVVVVLSLFGWLGLASTIRNQIIIIRNREFNVASRTLGSRSTAIITHNLLPQLVSIIVTLLANSIPAAIDGEVSLSFFGLSLSTVTRPSLGNVINDGAADTNWVEYPHIVLLPALVTIMITISCYYIGFSLADASDPRTHR